MKLSVNKTRERRFADINDRLKLLDNERVRLFLLEKGYFPESQFIPDDFFTTRDLVAEKKYQSLKKIKTTSKNEGDASFLFYPKNKYAIRALGIPPLEQYVRLSNYIADNWEKISEHLLLTSDDLVIPYSYPLFYSDYKRSDVGITNHKILNEIDLPEAINQYKYCIFLDIKSFYPNIYTHALAWSLDIKTMEIAERNNKKNWANQFDQLVRKLHKNRTKGILIGPYTSDLASEILLRSIDAELSKRIKEEKIEMAGYRFKDDYYLFVNELEEAHHIRTEIQQILIEYHLEVNEAKTKVIQTDEFSERKAWKAPLERLKQDISAVFKKKDRYGRVQINEKELRLWLMETAKLFEEFNDEYIVKTILGKFIQKGVNSITIKGNKVKKCPYVINIDEAYNSIFSVINNLCEKVPSAWPLFMSFICLLNSENIDLEVKKKIEFFLLDCIDRNINQRDSFLLVWTLYAFWRNEFQLGEKLKGRIRKEFFNNWLVLAFIDADAGIEYIDRRQYKLTIKNHSDLRSLHEVISVFSYGSKI